MMFLVAAVPYRKESYINNEDETVPELVPRRQQPLTTNLERLGQGKEQLKLYVQERAAERKAASNVPQPKLPMVAREELLLRQLERHRKESIPTRPTAPTKLEIQQGLESLSKNLRTDGKIFSAMAKERKGNPKFWDPKELPEGSDPARVYPSKHELAKHTEFGKPHLNHAYNVLPELAQVIYLLFKSNVLGEEDEENIKIIYPDSRKLRAEMERLRHRDFRALTFFNFHGEGQPDINRKREEMRLACLLHYDLDLAAVQRYCGGRFTGSHRRVEEMMYWLRYVVCEDTFTQLMPGYIDGIPNRLVADVPYSEFRLYKKRGNQKNVDKLPELVKKQVVREDARDISFVFPAWAADFIPHVGLIPVGIATPKHKKPRMYRHGTLKLGPESQPVNTIVVPETEPEIRYATVFVEHCQYLWRMRATFPGQRIEG